ncbi:MAG: PQQ-binding-like beta-propeller repeat protein [Acidobacteriota bacterium]
MTDAVCGARVPANDPLAGSWLTYGHAQGETRYSTLKQIDATNAKRLGLAFSYPMGAGGGNQEGTPLVWNNTLYGITSWSVVFAIQANTGEELWRWDPEINQQTVRPKICCGVVNRGIAIYNGLIIAPSNDGRLFALNALTGKPVWETRAVYSQDDFTLTMAPRIAGGKVIIGAAGGDKPTRGRFMAFDAMTGKHAWTFYYRPRRSLQALRKRSHAPCRQNVGRRLLQTRAAVERYGTASPTIPKRIWSTSVPATPNRGSKSSAARRT